MVDFDNEATIGTPAIDIIRVLVLQARAYTFEAWEDYHKKRAAGIEANLNVVYARLHAWFDELQAALKRKLKKEDYRKLKDGLAKNKDEQALRDVTYFLNGYLDEIKLTRLDTKKDYDKTGWESENKEAGI